MVFSSTIFLFFFLPAVLLVYYLLFHLWRRSGAAGSWRMLMNGFLLLASLLFYAWGEPTLTWVMLLSSAIDFAAGLFIERDFQRRPPEARGPGVPRSFGQKAALVASLSANMALLGFFKYFHFGLAALNHLLAAAGLGAWQLHPAIQISLPVGISFYTFQSMSYTIDVYRGETRGIRNYVDFACYVTLFPQLVAGPIVRYQDIADQLVHRLIGRSDLFRGLFRFIVGLAKKVLIADLAAQAADPLFELNPAALSTPAAWLGVVAYAIQIYFDFSGYSDMAIGLGRMMGFEFCENFNHPYAARSITDFWRRWHISLSTWFRDYLYIPLGGNRRSPARTAFNLYVVFVLCGLWHGAGWSFLAWGLFHGMLLCIERLFRRPRGAALHPAWQLPARLYTLLAVLVSWVLFRAETLPRAAGYLAAMAGHHPFYNGAHSFGVFASPAVLLAIAAGLAFSIPWWRNAPGAARLSIAWSNREASAAWGPTLVHALTAAVLFALCAIKVLAGTYSPFIYFRF